MSRYVFRFPNGNVQTLDYFPDPKESDPQYAQGQWRFFKKNSAGMDVYRLEFPPATITFRTDASEVSMRSDEIDENCLPAIPPKTGMEGYWDIPSDLYKDIVLHPSYRPIKYKLTMVDCVGSRQIVFTVNEYPSVPAPRQKDGFVGRWEEYQIGPYDLVIKASYSPVKIAFNFDGKRVVQLFSECKPPELEDKPGYERKWHIPDVAGSNDIELYPQDTPIRYNLTIHKGKQTSTVQFTVEDPPKLPKIPNMDGLIGSWSQFDHHIPMDQEAHLEYRLPIIRCHAPDGTVYEYEGIESANPPAIDGYKWPRITSWNKDQDIYAYPEIRFALFYVGGNLRFCVPFTIIDRHYVDEMLSRRTVPRYRRRYGVWKRIKSMGNGTECYSADYSHPEPILPRERTSFEWDLELLPAYVKIYGSTIELDGKGYDLFRTGFSEYTGINPSNLTKLIPCKLENWLRRERIPYKNRVKEYYVRERSDGSFTLAFSGRFWIGYDPRMDEALDFLSEEYEICFKAPRATQGSRTNKSDHGSRKIAGLEARYLSFITYFEDEDEIVDVIEKESPLDILIKPMFKAEETAFSKLTWESVDTEVTESALRYAMEANDGIIELFHTEFCPQCDFNVTGPDSVDLISFHSDESEFEIPDMVFLNENDSKGYKVERIGPEAFKDCNQLESIAIPNTVVEICNSAFAGCTALEKIIGGARVQIIGADAFSGCDELESMGDLRMFDSESSMEMPSSETSPDTDPHQDVDSSLIGPDDDLDTFLEKLSECEFRYLEAVCMGSDTAPVLKKYGKRSTMVELSINEKSCDFLNLDTMISDGIIDKDFEEELKRRIMESRRCAQ